MNKIIVSLLFVLLMSFSLASAISVISVSQIDFKSNDPNFNGPVFVVTSIENKGQDEIQWSMQNFESQLPNDYEMQRTGSIVSDFKNYYWQHAIKITAVDVGAKIVGTKDILFRSNAISWCEGLNGNYIVKKLGTGVRWDCVKYEIEGYVAQFEQGQWMYQLDYIVNINGVGSDVVTLTQSSTSNSKLISPKNYFNAVVQTMGTTFKADPIIDAKIRPYYKFGSGEWIILANSFPPGAFNNPENFGFYMNGRFFGGVDKCFDYYDGVYTDTAQRCINAYNQAKVSYLDPHYGANILPKPLDFSGISTTTFTGSVKYNDGLIYRNPMVTLTLKADNLVVKRSFGKAQISNVQYPKDMIVGQSYSFAVDVKNIGEADMDATLNMNCPSFSVSLPQRFPIKKGETVTQKGTIIFTGVVTGCQDSQPCVLQVLNTNSGIVDDTKSFVSEICRPSECNNVGTSTCIGDDIMQCVDLKGSYVFQKIQTCKPGECIVEGTNAKCKTDVESDYKLCPNGDYILKTDKCPDNTLWIIIAIIGGLALISIVLAFVSKNKGGRGGAINLG